MLTKQVLYLGYMDFGMINMSKLLILGGCNKYILSYSNDSNVIIVWRYVFFTILPYLQERNY